MSQKINEILEHLMKACTAGTEACNSGIISDAEYRTINACISNLEYAVREMGA